MTKDLSRAVGNINSSPTAIALNLVSPYVMAICVI